MAKTDIPNGAESALNTLLSGARGGQARMVHDWRVHCEQYARYFASLSKATGPSDILAANADLMISGLDALTRRAASLPSVDGVGRPAV